MDAFFEMLTSRVEHLLGRTAGPLNFRLLIMPLVVTFFAVRAAMRDARQGQPPFFRTLLTQPGERARLVRSVLKDVGKIFVVAIVLDTTYQILVSESRSTSGNCSLWCWYPPSCRISWSAVRFHRSCVASTGNNPKPANPKDDPKDRPASTI